MWRQAGRSVQTIWAHSLEASFVGMDVALKGQRRSCTWKGCCVPCSCGACCLWCDSQATEEDISEGTGVKTILMSAGYNLMPSCHVALLEVVQFCHVNSDLGNVDPRSESFCRCTGENRASVGPEKWLSLLFRRERASVPAAGGGWQTSRMFCRLI